MQYTVTDNPGQSRYEIRDEQGQLAGFAQYHLRGGVAAFIHTEIKSGFEGRGLASALVRRALDEVRLRELTVAPFCPFVRSFIARHPGYLDLVPAGERERFGLAGENAAADPGWADADPERARRRPETGGTRR